MKIFLFALFAATNLTLLTTSCDGGQGDQNGSCTWRHSQIVGSEALSELNDSVTSFVVALECGSVELDEEMNLYVQDATGSKIYLHHRGSKGTILVYEANLADVSSVGIVSDIPDEYYRNLSNFLASSHLYIIGQDQSIAKASNYETTRGYKTSRSEDY